MIGVHSPVAPSNVMSLDLYSFRVFGVITEAKVPAILKIL